VTLDRLTTERLVLRAWEEADAEALFAVYAHDDVWPWLGSHPAPCPDLETARSRPARWGTLTAGPLGFWAVETPGVGAVPLQPCGSVILLTLPRSDGATSDAVEIGWALHPSAWGHGIATEASQALVQRAREAGLPRLHAVVRPGNERSLAVCDRLGMRRLGLTDEWYGVDFIDHVLDL
jgi:RimJ/RimL family protein N-acetyltransferase